MRRRLLSMVLSVTMMLSLMPSAAFAESGEAETLSEEQITQESEQVEETQPSEPSSEQVEETEPSQEPSSKNKEETQPNQELSSESDVESSDSTEEVTTVDDTSEEPASIIITKQPEDVAVYVYDQATFSVEATGNGLSYEWFCYNGKRWNAVGENENTYSVYAEQSLNGHQYMCVISDEEGNEVESEIAVLTIIDRTEITLQPEDAGDVFYGETARFEIETQSSVSVQYRWMQSEDGKIWDDAYCTDSIFEVQANNDTAKFYMCQVTDDYGTEINSNIVTFNLVYRDLNLLSSQGDFDENNTIRYFYNNYEYVNIAIDVENYDNIEYQYTWETNDGDGWNSREDSECIDVSENYTDKRVTRVQAPRDARTDEINGRQYRLHVTDSQGKETYSDIFTVEIVPTVIEWLSQPATGTGSYESEDLVLDEYKETITRLYGNGVDLYAKFKPTWGRQSIENTGLDYQWEYNSGSGWSRSDDNDYYSTWSWSKDEGDDVIYTLKCYCRHEYEEGIIQYRVHIWDNRGNDIYSEPVAVNTVKEPLEIIQQPVSQEVMYSEDAVFAVEVKGRDVSYQWQRYDEENDEWTGDLWWTSERRESTLVVGGSLGTDGMKLRCIIQDSQNQQIYTDEVTLTVKKREQRIQSVTETEDGILSVKYGESVILEATIIDNSNINTWYSWQMERENSWEDVSYSTEQLDGNIKVRFADTSYPSYDGAKFRFHVQDEQGYDLYSDEITLKIIREELKITVQPEDVHILYGEYATFSAEAEGKYVSYHWQRYNEENDSWEDDYYIGSGGDHYYYTEPTFTIQGFLDQNGTKFRCRIQDSQEQEIYTNEVTLTVTRVELKITTQPENIQVPYNEDATFTVEAEGRDVHYCWQRYNEDSEYWEDYGIPNGWGYTYYYRDPTFVIRGNSDTDGMRIRCRISDNQDQEIYTNEVTLTVTREELKITLQPEDAQIFMYDDFTLKIAAKGKDLTYRWQRSKDGEYWEDLNELEGTHYWKETLKPEILNYKYRCHIWDNQGQEVYSNIVTVSMKNQITSVVEGNYSYDVNGVHLFEFIPSESGQYVINSVGINTDATGSSNDTYGELYNSKWEQITSDDDSGSNGNFAMSANLIAGETYYICVRYCNTSLSGEINWRLIRAEDNMAIQSQTGNVTIHEGEGTEFSVNATGVGLTYRWYYSKNGGEMWKAMSEEGSTLQVTGTKANNGYMYYCKVKDRFGNSRVSDPMTLTVLNAELVVVTPRTKVVASQDEWVTLSVEATGTNLSYEWYYSKNNGRTWRRSFEYSSAYYLYANLSQNGYKYYCNVRDEYGNEESSDEITFIVKDYVEKKDISDAIIKLEKDSYDYTGKAIKPEMVVSYNGEELIEREDYEIVKLDVDCISIGDFDIEIRGIGEYEGSVALTIHVVEPELSEILVTTAPNKVDYLCSQEFKPDGMKFTINYVNGASRSGSAEELGISFEANLSVAAPTVTMVYEAYAYGPYSFEYPVTVIHNVVIDEAVEPTEESTGLTEGSHCDGCGEILKEQETIDKIVKLAITSQPESVVATNGEKVQFTVEATGSDLTYEWYCYNPNTGTDYCKSSDTTNTYTVTADAVAHSQGFYVYCVVSDKYENSVKSEVASLQVEEKLEIVKQPQSVQVKNGDKAAFTVEAAGIGLTYTWYYNNPSKNSEYYRSSNATNTYTITANSAAHSKGFNVYCVVKDAKGNSVTTEIANFTIVSAATITKQPQSVSVKNGDKVEFTVEAEGDGLTYAWYYKNPNSSAEYRKSSNTTNTYTITANATTHSKGFYVYCIVSDKNGNSVKSDVASLKIGSENEIEIVKQPQSVQAEDGDKVAFTVEAKGTNLTYTWYYKNPNTSVEYRKSSNTTNTYTITANKTTHSKGFYVYCVVEDSKGNRVTTEIARFTIGTAVTIIKQPKSVLVKDGDKAEFTVEAEGEGLTYAWYYKNPNASLEYRKSSNTTNTYTITANSNTHNKGFYVYCVVSDKNGNSVKSDIVSFKIGNENKLITKQPENVSVGDGETAIFTVEAAGEGLTYTWYYNNPNTDSTYYKSSSKTNTYTIKANAHSHSKGFNVYCVVTDSNGNSEESDIVTMTVKEVSRKK